MRIVFGVHEFFPDFAAGTEVITLSVARELRRRGHEVHIVTGFPAPAGTLTDAQRFDQYTYDGFVIDRFKHSYEQIGTQSNIMEHEHCNELFGQQFGRVLDRVKPDVAHFFNLARLSASVLDACFERHVPAYFTATDFWAICPLAQLRLADNRLCSGPDSKAINCIRHLADLTGSTQINRILKCTPNWTFSLALGAAQRGLLRWNPYSDEACAMTRRRDAILSRLNRTKAVFAPSKLMAEKLAQHGICSKIIRYLPYGVDVSGIRRQNDKGTHPRLRVGFIGTLSEHKGPHVVIEAIRSLPNELPIDLSIWGPDGSDIRYIQRLHFMARQHGQISFAGAFTNGTLNKVLGEIDLLVVPSLWLENTPMVIYEAIGGGVPVIATDLAGLTESIPEGAGEVFPKGDSAALARTIAELCANRPRVAKMSAACRAPMTIEDHVAELERAYAENGR